jgi:hypothetical protein
MTVRPCWNCRQPATHTLTREGSNTLLACDNCTRIDRAEAESRGWTVGALISETPVTTGTKKLTVSTVLIDEASSSYWTVIRDDHDDKRHHDMRLGDSWIIGRDQQMGTRHAALALHEEAVEVARIEEPRPLN